jgi:hypothetical protein
MKGVKEKERLEGGYNSRGKMIIELNNETFRYVLKESEDAERTAFKF